MAALANPSGGCRALDWLERVLVLLARRPGA